jgi:hypothetical protein
LALASTWIIKVSSPLHWHETQSAGVKSSPKPPLKLFPTMALTVPGAHDIFHAAATSAFGIGWEDGAQTWQGERREPAEAAIQLHVKPEWAAGGYPPPIQPQANKKANTQAASLTGLIYRAGVGLKGIRTRNNYRVSIDLNCGR